MKGRERILLIVVLCLIAGTAGALQYMKLHQRLGKPGIRASAIPDSMRMHIELPTNAAGYFFKEIAIETNVTDVLPKDTSIRQALYRNVDGEIQVTVVMMGTDRTSIHRPEFCLTGLGWNIDGARSEVATVRLRRPQPVDLPVMKLVANKTIEVDGKKASSSGVYVYWFVAENAFTPHHGERVWNMAAHLLKTGELQRWAYITYFCPCRPGAEEYAFERIKKLMNATVPDFQLAWPAGKNP